MKKIMEINPYHPFVREMLERVKAGAEPDTEEMFKVMYDVALMNAGKCYSFMAYNRLFFD
jgi:HSP90 family molecular chaperone